MCPFPLGGGPPPPPPHKTLTPSRSTQDAPPQSRHCEMIGIAWGLSPGGCGSGRPGSTPSARGTASLDYGIGQGRLPPGRFLRGSGRGPGRARGAAAPQRADGDATGRSPRSVPSPRSCLMRISARNVLAAAALAALAVGAASGLGVREGAPGNPGRRLFFDPLPDPFFGSPECLYPPCDSSGGFWDFRNLAPLLETLITGSWRGEIGRAIAQLYEISAA